ncbi:MAG: hypothetical protein AB4040_09900 [Synechococcus sp.]
MTGQFTESYVSPRLQEFSVFYSNRLSYEEVAALVERVSGAKLLSDQTIWNLSVAKAQQFSHGLEREVEEAQKSDRFRGLSVNPSVDLYARDSREILLFQDGIQVKQQKAERLSQISDTIGPSKKQPGLMTDVALLEKKTGQYEYICAPINKQGNLSITLSTVVKARVALEYGHSSGPLNLVAITDGARSIASGLRTTFSSGLVMILDWYHLVKKLRSMMSMIAWDKEDKVTRLKFIIPKLWLGETDAVLTYLKMEVTPRREDKWKELIRYIEKHQSEIINYNRRSRAGKVIGSGRMEKGVDLTIGRRQKKKGMSWRAQGSRSLGILKVAELNGDWDQLWDFSTSSTDF